MITIVKLRHRLAEERDTHFYMRGNTVRKVVNTPGNYWDADLQESIDNINQAVAWHAHMVLRPGETVAKHWQALVKRTSVGY